MIGIGYRKDFAADWDAHPEILCPDFIEVAPENWIDVGGYWKKLFDKVLGRYPLFTHGLSLSIGSPDPVDFHFLKKVKSFLDHTQAVLYSEHLSFSRCDNAHLYDLLPIPFTEEAVWHVVFKIRKVQDYLQRPLTIENVSYYSSVSAQLTELQFINAILEESNCQLLLDVNNVYVNSFNHGYDPKQFIAALPRDRVAYIHMAGHLQVDEDLIIDTHGEDIIDPVYDLFRYTLDWLDRPVPVLLERDFNVPALSDLQSEIDQLDSIYRQKFSQHNTYPISV